VESDLLIKVLVLSLQVLFVASSFGLMAIVTFRVFLHNSDNSKTEFVLAICGLFFPPLSWMRASRRFSKDYFCVRDQDIGLVCIITILFVITSMGLAGIATMLNEVEAWLLFFVYTFSIPIAETISLAKIILYRILVHLNIK